ncbi:MAG: R3H domain-containing nucleic acid-binding protein [Candidatus Paceibacterota bacterium]|jgi:spoIIIJ-associated protein
MEKEEIQNLIKELIEKTTVKLNKISIIDDKPKNIWVSVEVSEPHFFIGREGEGLHALSYLVHRIIESKNPRNDVKTTEPQGLGVIIDINGFQKKHVESIRAIAHMMSERARYFKSNIEIDPMSAFERRIVHEFLSEANDLKTESVGFGRDRRVVIKYIGVM